jgi:hypothetical protein
MKSGFVSGAFLNEINPFIFYGNGQVQGFRLTQQDANNQLQDSMGMLIILAFIINLKFHDWENWWCLFQGFRTGYIYRYPLVKGEPPRPRNDIEVPPAVSSLGYLLEEEELYKHG